MGAGRAAVGPGTRVQRRLPLQLSRQPPMQGAEDESQAMSSHQEPQSRFLILSACQPMLLYVATRHGRSAWLCKTRLLGAGAPQHLRAVLNARALIRAP